MGKKTVLLIGVTVLILAIFLGWLFKESSKPLPGEKLTDLGREHVDIGTEVKYNSNPPTSGPHYVDWIRAGVYSEPKDDRNLVHSLEHGYIIMSYNCQRQTLINESQRTPNQATSSAQMTEDCKLVDQLKQIYEKKGQRKLIVIPRPDLDNTIALTAWTYLDKFHSTDSGLSEEEKVRIEKFIDAHRDRGPEATNE